MRVGHYLNDFSQDFRYAVRAMRTSPGVTALVVSSLALGIGANTAIFSLVYPVLIRALPVAEPEQLVELLQKYPGEPRGNGYWSPRSYEHYRDHNHVFSSLTGTAIDNIARVRIEGSHVETVVAENVAGNYFSLLGVRPALGRLIGPEDRSAAESPVAVVSWSVWNNRFQRDPGVLGKRVFVGEKPVEIVGVAPQGFSGLRVNAQTAYWLPANPTAGLNLLGRLKPGVTIAQARAEMETLFRFTIEERAAGSKDPQVRQLRVELEPARAGFSGLRDQVGKPLGILMAIVAVLLLLACFNVAGVLLARAAGRQREMSLRLGLGATRWRLIRQVLVESLLLSGLGTAAGIAVAVVGTPALLRILDSGRPHERVHLEVQPDSGVILFTAAIAILTGLLFGTAPAWSAFRQSPADALRQTGRALTTRFQRLFGNSLVASQIALSMLLLSCGGLFVGHLASLKGKDLGFRRDHVLLVRLDSSGSGYSGQRLSNAYAALIERLGTIPGARSVSLGAPTPLMGAGASAFASAEGFEDRPENRRRVAISWVAPKYFETIGTPVLNGREFRFDDQVNSRVAIVSQGLARSYFGNLDPLGKRITLDGVTNTRGSATYQIVGVAGDSNYREIRETDLERRSIYLPAFRTGSVIAGTFLIRTDVAPESIVGEVRRAVSEVVPAMAIANITTLGDQVDASIVPERLMASLSGFIAGLGALLAGIGVYGLLAFAVARRTQEMGIRLALGATPGAVLRMIMREGLMIVAVGLCFGLLGALWGRSLAVAMIQDLAVETTTPLAFGVLAIVTVALLACQGPARRAARVDPMQSLRHE